MRRLKTGELVKLAEVNVETIRFYERKGLLPEPPRMESGYRSYPEENVQRIRFIKRAQQLGFSLKEIQELLNLRSDQTANCVEMRMLTEKKITEVRGKINDLKHIEKALTELLDHCRERNTTETCLILGFLDGENF